MMSRSAVSTSFRLGFAAGCLVFGAALASAQQSTNRAAPSTNRAAPSTNRTTGSSGNRSSNASSAYPNSTAIGEAVITSDAETRRIIVVTDDETNEDVKKVILSLDQPKPQVLINVVFLQVTHGKDLDLGVEGKYTDRNLPNNTTGIAQTLFGIAGTTSGGFYRVLNQNVDATIRALATIGKTEILSRPSILARNNQMATITVGQEVPFITNSRVTETGQTVNTVQYQDIGIILRVTPFITQDGLVEMIVAPEISSLSDRTVALSSTASTPVIDKRSADTVVVTPSDKTVVIGGLISTQVTESVNKVPILGDIPLIGLAFKRTVKQDVKTELLIFLTPHVIATPGEMSKVTEDERAKLEIVPKTFDEKELKRYVNPQ